MDKMKAKVVIVEDDVQLKDDPFIEEAKEVFEEVHFIENSCSALEYIESHISDKMIVVLDLEFAYNMPNGRDVLNRIREISFLVPVIIWSAVDEGTDTVSDLIRNRAFAYYKKEQHRKN